jgi:hypothetical protein
MRLLHVLLVAMIALVLGAPASAADPPAARPAATAGDWAANPDASLHAVLEQADTLVALAKAIHWSSWLLCSAVVLVVACRRLPGFGGAVANLVWWALAPSVERQADKAREVQADGFRYLVRAIESVPPDTPIARVKDKAARTMPDAVKQAVTSYLETGPMPLTMLIDPAAAPSKA